MTLYKTSRTLAGTLGRPQTACTAAALTAREPTKRTTVEPPRVHKMRIAAAKMETASTIPFTTAWNSAEAKQPFRPMPQYALQIHHPAENPNQQ